MLDELGSRHDAALMVHHVRQQPILVRSQADWIAVDGHAAGAGVEPHGAADQLARGVARSAAHEGAQPGQHFLHVKGLGHIIVRARVKAVHLVAPATARGEQENRSLSSRPAPFLKHRQAVLFGKTNIEHDSVVGLRVAEEMPLLAVKGLVHGVARLFQRGDELAVQINIILDNEKTHAGAPCGAKRLFRPTSARRRDGSARVLRIHKHADDLPVTPQHRHLIHEALVYATEARAQRLRLSPPGGGAQGGERIGELVAGDDGAGLGRGQAGERPRLLHLQHKRRSRRRRVDHHHKSER